MNFAGKAVLITGASSGIGAATALKFAQQGARLVLVGRSDMAALKVVGEKCAVMNKSTPHLVVGDVSKDSDVKCLWKETLNKLSKLDVLVNAAGTMESGSIETTSLEQFDRTIATNLRSIYHLTMLAVPELIKTKGSIVNISSVCGLRAFPNLQAYNISKSGVDQLTRCVALELGARGVRCNAVNPGVILTKLQRSGGMSDEEYKKFLKHSKTTHPMGRVGEPDEVANVICFLASDLASFVTGVCLSVDGGKQLMCPR